MCRYGSPESRFSPAAWTGLAIDRRYGPDHPAINPDDFRHLPTASRAPVRHDRTDDPRLAELMKNPSRAKQQPGHKPKPSAGLSPALIKHAEERAVDGQNRLADAITRFAGSMVVVYIHCDLVRRLDRPGRGEIFVRSPSRRSCGSASSSSGSVEDYDSPGSTLWRCIRESMSSFKITLRRGYWTVLGLMNNRAATVANRFARSRCVRWRPGPAVVISSMRQDQQLPRRCHGPPAGTRARHLASARTPGIPGTTHALEWTRTTTGESPHNALNLAHARQMRPPASKSSN
jgi:hypothetical protein